MARIRQALLAGVLLAAACGGGDNGGTNPPPGGGNREWTVMVYMAADNSLAAQGVFDMDEMEAAGVTTSITTVVQAEFSPDVIAQYNGCDASCFNRPNFNTFRYEITGQGTDVNGPNGPATDIGNVDMTSPTTLKNFIDYAKATYPANHYLLVLWNHGGGYTGLIQDQTSSGSGLMSVDELKTALTGSGIDVLDFDMCLMAGYETLVKVGDLVSQVVFSEEVVPGAGNPYSLDHRRTPGRSHDDSARGVTTHRRPVRCLLSGRQGLYHDLGLRYGPAPDLSLGRERRGNGTLGRAPRSRGRG